MFYKYENEQLEQAGVISTPEYELSIDTKEQFSYPKDGWYWFDNISKANEFFKLGVQTVSMRQARLALLDMNLMELIETTIQTMSAEAKINWEYSTIVERDNILITELVTSLNLTSEQLDSFFEIANSK